MGKLVWKGGTLLAPVPAVLVTCSDGVRDNVFTVAWTGLINTQPPKTYISVRPQRFSYDLIASSGEFVINLTPSSLAAACDWCGVHTGRKRDKFEKFSLEKLPAAKVSAPLIAQCPIALECRVFDVIKMETHHMFLADIVAVDVDEELLDADGRLCIDRADLCAFAHGEYFRLGDSLGKFGFSVRKKHGGAAKGAKANAENKGDALGNGGIKPAPNKTVGGRKMTDGKRAGEGKSNGGTSAPRNNRPERRNNAGDKKPDGGGYAARKKKNDRSAAGLKRPAGSKKSGGKKA